VRRVLKPGGVFLLISHAPPDRRLPALQREAWSIRATHVGKPVLHANDDDAAAAAAATADSASVAAAQALLQGTGSKSRYHVYTCVKSGVKRRGASTAA
jgi:hypothetical protein